jgi:hypothetical protein
MALNMRHPEAERLAIELSKMSRFGPDPAGGRSPGPAL